jgi:putative ABC transport system substrate-binding protein
LKGPEDIDRVFTSIVGEGVQAIQVVYVPVTWTHRRQIIDLAARHRLPAIYWHRGYALDGGLMAYGEDEREVPQRLAVYLDRILRGARPADLPVEQPTKVELVINLKTAKALGLTIPQPLLWQADQLIE